ncbi:beta-defensin 103A-like [Cervus elaphus]|uniref:beta-defensin 103A-like n=1 Tax=Cervus elaphus TaxID=9860 RepID=UPI001CC2D594|nr:beta-defensin 103A-like [Cervus elaphus]
MRVYYLLFEFLFLFLLPVPGNSGIISGFQKDYCKRRSGRCALIGCLPNEEQIGRCALSGRKCFQKKK